MGNPYNYHLPVMDDAMFFGRARLLRRLGDGLTQPRPISAAIFGGRRCGKTSFLRKLERDMRSGRLVAEGRRLIPWYYDPQAGYPIACGDDFFLLVLDELRRSLALIDLPRAAIEDVYGRASGRGPVWAFETGFRALTERVQGRIRLVLLIDEAETLLTAPWGGDLRPNLRNLLSNSGIADSVALVMAGSTSFHHQVTERDSPLENILTRYILLNLEHEHTLALAREPNGGRLPLETAEEVWRQTGGHPCLVQFILHELWYDLEGATEEDVQDVAASFSEMVDHFERWNGVLSSLAHRIYRWLLERGRPSSYGAVRRAFAREDGGEVQRALETLAYHGLINISGRGRRTRYQIAGKMFPEWYLGDRPTGAKEEGKPAYTIHIGSAHGVAIGDGASVVLGRGEPRPTPRQDQARAEPPGFEFFDLEVEPRGEGRYEIQVLHSPTGALYGQAVEFDPRAPDLAGMVERVRVGDVDGALLAEVGRRLHAFLFPPQVRSAYLTARQMARDRGLGLCLRLRVHQAELAALPWELLYDEQDRNFVALSDRTPMARSLSGALESPLPPASAPWRMLLVTASPADLPPLDVDRERDGIMQALRPLEDEGRVTIVVLDHASLRDLLDALRRGPHWLHFIGHGRYDEATQSGALFFERDGRAHEVDVETLRHLLPEAHERPEGRLRLVFLNACATAQVGVGPGTRGLAQALVQAGIPAAIGMGRPIAGRSAIAFSEGFYGTLAKGWPIYAAVSEGRRRVMVDSGLHGGDWAVPVLLVRHGLEGIGVARSGIR